MALDVQGNLDDRTAETPRTNLLFVGGTAHDRWMDVFLAHLSSHYVPGRNVTWYVVFLLCLGTYLYVLDRLRERAVR